jgi:hypothetical protein
MNAEIVTARAVATAIVRKTLESSIGEAGDFNWGCELTQIYADLIRFGADADEFEESDGGAQDDAANQEPGLGAKPAIKQVTEAAKGSY